MMEGDMDQRDELEPAPDATKLVCPMCGQDIQTTWVACQSCGEPLPLISEFRAMRQNVSLYWCVFGAALSFITYLVSTIEEPTGIDPGLLTAVCGIATVEAVIGSLLIPAKNLRRLCWAGIAGWCAVTVLMIATLALPIISMSVFSFVAITLGYQLLKYIDRLQSVGVEVD